MSRILGSALLRLIAGPGMAREDELYERPPARVQPTPLHPRLFGPFSQIRTEPAETQPPDTSSSAHSASISWRGVIRWKRPPSTSTAAARGREL